MDTSLAYFWSSEDFLISLKADSYAGMGEGPESASYS